MRDACRSVVATLLAIFFATALTAQGGAVGPQTAPTAPPAKTGSPQDMKGWRGAEWGMSPAQVATALNLPPKQPTVNKRDRSESWLPIPDTQVGSWLARVEMTFHQDRLFAVTLRIPVVSDSMKVCEEVAATYGPPISNGEEPTWLLAQTQITCRLAPLSNGSIFHVRYQQRAKAFQ